MSRREPPAETEARRFQALDDLLASPCELSAELEQRLLSIPSTSRRTPRRLLAAAAAAVLLVGGALALRPSSEAPPAPRSTAPSRGDRVVVALRHPSEAGRAFLEQEGDRVLVTLHRLARDPDPAVAVPAIERLGVLARRASLPVLVDVVRRADRRGAAIRALALLGDPAGARAVAPYLSDPAERLPARDALVAVGGKDAVAALLEVVDGSERPDALLQAIARIRDPSAVAALLGLRERPTLAVTARDALGAVHHRRALLAVAGGRDRVLALAAIRTIERLASPEAVPVLRAALTDAGLRRVAARALAVLDTPASGAALLDHLGARGVRDAFEHAGPGIETWLRARLEGGSRRERLRVVGLLALCGSAESVPTLCALASDAALAPAIVEALGRMGGPASVAALEDLAERSSLRRPVLEALAATASADAVPALVRLGASDRRLRRPAIAALGRIPHADAVHGILTLDGQPATRRTTERTLRAMDHATVVPVLVALLDGDRAAEARRWLHSVRP